MIRERTSESSNETTKLSSTWQRCLAGGEEWEEGIYLSHVVPLMWVPEHHRKSLIARRSPSLAELSWLSTQSCELYQTNGLVESRLDVEAPQTEHGGERCSSRLLDWRAIWDEIKGNDGHHQM